MVTLKPADELKKAYQYFDPLRPLSGDWLKSFYVERPPDSRIDPFITALQIDESEDDKTLFTAQQGAGESTELNRLMEMLKDSHITVYFDIVETMNLGDIDYTDLLVSLGLHVFRKAREIGVKSNDKFAENLIYWYEERFLEKEEAMNLKSEISTEVNLGLLKFGSKLAQDPPFRKVVRQKTQSGLSDLLTRLNELLTHLRQKFNRRIMVIVDGLDKTYDLRKVSDLFLHGANALIAPQCRIIYTVPYPLFYSYDFQQIRQQFHRNYLMPNVKIRNKDGTPYEKGQEMLRQVILKRINEELIEPEAINAIIEFSGGLLRELIRLTRLSILSAINRDRTRVNTEDVEWAKREIKATFRRILTFEDYRALWNVYETKSINSLPPDLTDKLLHIISILEYNGDTWWDVHPIVTEILEESKKGENSKGEGSI